MFPQIFQFFGSKPTAPTVSATAPHPLKAKGAPRGPLPKPTGAPGSNYKPRPDLNTPLASTYKAPNYKENADITWKEKSSLQNQPEFNPYAGGIPGLITKYPTSDGRTGIDAI